MGGADMWALGCPHLYLGGHAALVAIGGVAADDEYPTVLHKGH